MITAVPLRAGKGWAKSWTCHGVSGLIFSLIRSHVACFHVQKSWAFGPRVLLSHVFRGLISAKSWALLAASK